MIEPWNYRNFLRDTKLRTTERYRRDGSPFIAATVRDTSNIPTLVIPDALVWRKYLSLLRRIVTDRKDVMRLLLTESAVELMDYRNQRHETPAPYERSILKRLFVAGGDSNVITVIPDLTLELDDDEWDTLDYGSMSVSNRCQSAHIRLANALVHHGRRQNKIVLLVESEADARFTLENDEIVEYRSIEGMVDLLVGSEKTASAIDGWTELQQRCAAEYARRNSVNEEKDEHNYLLRDLSPDELQEKLQSGEIFRGRFHVNKDNVTEGFVQTNTDTLFIHHEHYNHAFHQDIVIVAPLPESQWGRPVGRRRLVHHRDNPEEGGDDGDDDVVDITPVPSARIIAIQEPGRRVFVATMVDQPDTDDSAVLVIPMDIRIPKIRVKTRSWRRFVGQRLKIEVMEWDGNYPSGRCVEVLGAIGDLETEVMALLIENQVELEPFTKVAQACLPRNDWKVLDEHVKNRKDFRKSRRVFSVDPPGCQDIDDTMHAEVLANGDIEVGVHIADVTHFVQHDSALDLEAQVRGTTFYLVDRRFDMLPSILSSDLCSLHGGVDRLAVSVVWVLSPDMSTVKSTWFGRTVIHNCAAMTYDQADNILKGKPPEPQGQPHPPPLTAGKSVTRSLIPYLKKDLSILTNLARKMRKVREERGGAVDLTGGESGGSELKFTLKSGIPQKVVPKEDKEIHHTIAELMILANSHVAAKLHEVFPTSALLRIHRSVEDSRLNELKEVLNTLDIKIESTDGKELALALNQAKKRAGNSAFQSLILSLATRSMTEAQYVSTGSREQGSELRHFGLGLEKYTHFTSPIRRYADVVVHKQLLAALSAENFDPKQSAVKKVDVGSLKDLPGSNMVSILAGEGLKEPEAEPEDNVVDLLISGASELVLGDKAPHENVSDSCSTAGPEAPYSGNTVSSICEGLNLHNRLAKQSSFECQGLFLSLYFKDHEVTTSAVVTNVRENGFFVYVPRFDLRGPVYLRDVQGSVQVDPALLNLLSNAGSPPTAGFRHPCRLFHDASCKLNVEENCLGIVLSNRVAYSVRPMDVVTIRLSCDDWDVRARIPQPKLHLIANKGVVLDTAPIQVRSGTLQQTQSKTQPKRDLLEETKSSRDTVFGVISNLEINPVLNVADTPTPMRKAENEMNCREEAFRGRVVYGNFVNPDTKSAKQQAAQLVAAEWRMRDKEVDYGTVTALERTVTSRQHRLAAGKRNTKRSKAK